MTAIVDIHTAYETHSNQSISNLTDEMFAFNQNMNTIVTLLETLRQDNLAGAVDYSMSDTKKALVDKLYAIAPHLLREDQAAHGDRYRWSKEECEILIDNISREPERIQLEINQVMSKITQLYNERNQVTDIVAQILKEMRELIRTFLSRINR